jgi:hypothetical protein
MEKKHFVTKIARQKFPCFIEWLFVGKTKSKTKNNGRGEEKIYVFNKNKSCYGLNLKTKCIERGEKSLCADSF